MPCSHSTDSGERPIKTMREAASLISAAILMAVIYFAGPVTECQTQSLPLSGEDSLLDSLMVNLLCPHESFLSSAMDQPRQARANSTP